MVPRRINSGSGTDIDGLYAWIDEVLLPQGLPEAVLFRLHVVAEEAVLNIAKHGFPPAQPTDFWVEIEAEPQDIVVRLTDDGHPFNPITAPPAQRPAGLEDATPGGLGLELMRRYCSRLDYEFVDGQNRLTLRFARNP